MDKQTLRRFFIVGCFVASVGACVPSHLQKYSSQQAAPESSPLDPSTEISPILEAGAPRPSGVAPFGAPAGRANTPSIYAVDSQTFRVNLRDEDVWDAVLSTLMRNYNLNVVDRASGVITTEWDSIYVNQIVYRNKVSVRVRKLTRGQSELIVHNNVEQLQDGSSAGTVGAVWLPGGEGQKEVGRIVQNVAILLNQPPPTLMPGMIANDTDNLPSNNVR